MIIFTQFNNYSSVINKKVFLEVEASLNFMSKKAKVNTISETGSPTVTVTSGKSGGFTTNVVGGVRIGFQF